MAPPLTPMQRLTIIALRNSGYRVSDIERRTGISKPSIHLWLKRYEQTGALTPRHRKVYRRATTAEQDAAIVAAHAKQPYLSTAETAAMFNVTKDTIRRRLKEGGLEHKKERGGGYGRSTRIKTEKIPTVSIKIKV